MTHRTSWAKAQVDVSGNPRQLTIRQVIACMRFFELTVWNALSQPAAVSTLRQLGSPVQSIGLGAISWTPRGSNRPVSCGHRLAAVAGSTTLEPPPPDRKFGSLKVRRYCGLVAKAVIAAYEV